MLDWKNREKSIEQLTEELKSFEDKSVKVEHYFDGRVASKPISLIGGIDGRCLLFSVVSEE